MFTPFKRIETQPENTYTSILTDISDIDIVKRPEPPVVRAPVAPPVTEATALLQDDNRNKKLQRKAWVSLLAWYPAFIVGMVSYEFYSKFILPDANNYFANCDLNGIIDGYRGVTPFTPFVDNYALRYIDVNPTQFLIDKAKMEIHLWGSMGRWFGVIVGDLLSTVPLGYASLFTSRRSQINHLKGYWGVIGNKATVLGILADGYRVATAFWPWGLAVDIAGSLGIEKDPHGNSVHHCWTEMSYSLGQDFATADYNNALCSKYLPGTLCPALYWQAIEAAQNTTATMQGFGENERPATFFIAAATVGGVMSVAYMLFYKLGSWINHRQEVAQDRQSMVELAVEDQRALQISELEATPAEEAPQRNCFTRIKHRFGW